MGSCSRPGTLTAASALLAAALCLPACLSMKSGGEPTALMKASGAEVSAAQLRSMGNELAIRIPALLERSGDYILFRTEDPLLRQRALGWKIEGTAAFHQALFRPDALGAAVETYALAVQLEDWVASPAGSKYYGEFQPILQDTTRQIRETLEQQALSVAKHPDRAREHWEKLGTWAHQNPIDDAFSVRPSIGSALAKITGNQDIGITDAFSGISSNVADLATRLDIYAWTLPKVARWQAEFAAIELTRADPGRMAIATLQSAHGLMTRLDAMSSPAGVKELSSVAMSSLRGERVAVLSDIDRQRQEVLAAITREREAILGNVDGQRVATLADLDRKIDRAMAGADGIRARAATDVEGILTRTLLRIALAAALLMVLGAVLGYALLRALRHRVS